METKMVRQPIVGLDKSVIGYELRYQDNGASLFNQADTVAANIIENFLVQFNSDALLDGSTAYLTFTPNLLMKNIPKMFQPEKMVIQIEDNSTVHPMAQKIVYRYKKLGFQIAVTGFQFAPRYFALLDVIDVIKMDLSQDERSLSSIIEIGKSFHKRVIAYNVNTKEAYEYAKSLGCEYFQGTAVAEAMYAPVKKLEHMQSNFFQLVIAVTRDEPDIDEISEIISRDVTLAFSVIKLVNSAYFALRNQARSVKQALVVLGLGQLKQWVYLLSFKNSDGELSEELIKTSFLRASFCQELAECTNTLSITKSEAYLLGMFSTLGLLMQVPLEDAVRELPINGDIKLALTNEEGPCAPLYKLLLSYESADWKAVTQCAQALKISENVISQKYFECCEAVNEIWRKLTVPYASDGKDPDAQPNDAEAKPAPKAEEQAQPKASPVKAEAKPAVKEGGQEAAAAAPSPKIELKPARMESKTAVKPKTAPKAAAAPKKPTEPQKQQPAEGAKQQDEDIWDFSDDFDF